MNIEKNQAANKDQKNPNQFAAKKEDQILKSLKNYLTNSKVSIPSKFLFLNLRNYWKLYLFNPKFQRKRSDGAFAIER